MSPAIPVLQPFDMYVNENHVFRFSDFFRGEWMKFQVREAFLNANLPYRLATLVPYINSLLNIKVLIV